MRPFEILLPAFWQPEFNNALEVPGIDGFALAGDLDTPAPGQMYGLLFDSVHVTPPQVGSVPGFAALFGDAPGDILKSRAAAFGQGIQDGNDDRIVGIDLFGLFNFLCFVSHGQYLTQQPTGFNTVENKLHGQGRQQDADNAGYDVQAGDVKLFREVPKVVTKIVICLDGGIGRMIKNVVYQIG